MCFELSSVLLVLTLCKSFANASSKLSSDISFATKRVLILISSSGLYNLSTVSISLSFAEISLKRLYSSKLRINSFSGEDSSSSLGITGNSECDFISISVAAIAIYSLALSTSIVDSWFIYSKNWSVTCETKISLIFYLYTISSN